jgi:hypothetical protein
MGASIIIDSNGSGAVAMPVGGNPREENHPDPTPGFIVRFDLSHAAFGDRVLIAQVEAADGRVWDAPVVSVGGAPAILHLIGGDAPNIDPPPATVLSAIHRELVRLWEEGAEHEKLMLRAVGFTEDVRRPMQPGRPPDSDANLAIRARRTINTPGGVDRVSETERDAFRRARSRGIHRQGEITEHGNVLLEEVDRAKTVVLEVLREDGRLTMPRLQARLSGIPEDVLDAAVLDLQNDDEITMGVEQCSSCGASHSYLQPREL